ncbi:MAG: tetratricopeptide repeat protein [Candidatus Omnitrophota bacterium]
MIRKMRLVCLFLFFFFVWVFCAYALDWRQLHDKADQMTLSEAQDALNRAPDSLDEMYTLALVYLNHYDVLQAKQMFEQMRKADPDSLEAQWGIAEVLRREHKIKEGRPILEKVIQKDPSYAPAYVTLGYMSFETKEYYESIRLAKKVLKMGQKNVDLANYVRAYLIIGGANGMIADQGWVFSKLFRGTKVLPYLRKAQRLQPDSAGVLFGLGSFYLLAPRFAGGNKKKALEYLHKAIEVDPHFVDAYARLAQAYKIEGDDKKAREFLAKALKIDGQNELALTIQQNYDTLQEEDNLKRKR